MPEKSVVLPDDGSEAREVFRQCLASLGWGIVVALGPDQEAAYKRLEVLCQDPDLHVTAVWAKEPGHIEKLIQGLENGGAVNFTAFGHKAVSINKLDQVSRCLSAFQATLFVHLLGAVWCAAREDKACDF